MKKILALILALVMALSLVACGEKAPAADDGAAAGDDTTVYKMNVSFAAPEFSTTEITAALDRIQAASNGRIEFTYYYSWSLSSVPTVVDDLTSGVVDIAAVPINEHLSLFPYSNLVTYTPFLGLPNMLDAAKIYDELYAENEVFAQEYANLGLKYWTNYPCPGYNIFTTKDNQIKTPDDLAGLKLITSSSMMAQFIEAHGGAVLNSPVTDYATNLNTNVADGVVNHANVLAAFGCMDFVNGVTVFGDQGTAVSIMMMCFSEDAWNALPADLQALFEAEATALRDGQGAWDNGANGGNIAGIGEKGGAVVELTEDEIKVWQDAFAPFLSDYIAELEAGGATEAQAIYDALQAKLAA
mgnify:CR=1 FL=1